MLFAGLSGLAPLAAGRTRRGIGWMAALPLVAQLVPEIFDRMNGPEKPSFP
jgi:hypothetical protein